MICSDVVRLQGTGKLYWYLSFQWCGLRRRIAPTGPASFTALATWCESEQRDGSCVQTRTWTGCWRFYIGFLTTVSISLGRYSLGCHLQCAAEPDKCWACSGVFSIHTRPVPAIILAFVGHRYEKSCLGPLTSCLVGLRRSVCVNACLALAPDRLGLEIRSWAGLGWAGWAAGRSPQQSALNVPRWGPRGNQNFSIC